MENDFTRPIVWAQFAAAILSMANHPGTTRDAQRPKAAHQIAEEADKMMREYDERFITPTGEK